MNGYNELNYNVLKSFILDDKNGKQVIQIRKQIEIETPKYIINSIKKCSKRENDFFNSKKNESCPYISIDFFDKYNNKISDILYFYYTNAQYSENDLVNNDNDIEVDWVLLTSKNKTVGYDDLKSNYRIENHHMGYGRNGSVTIY
jgi:hypothetical protein